MAKEIADEYASSLSDLTVNSKPLINMLTILAEENIEHAGVIVETVEKHLEKVPAEIKLPVLYLVDSIIKNVGGAYTQKFSQSIVNMFTKTFKQVDEKIRAQMFKLRETWHDVFPASKLYQLDVKVNLIDPAWPIQVQPQPTNSNIHVNPNFIKKPSTNSTEEEENMRIMLAKKEHELLMLQKKKIEMELEQTRRKLDMYERSTKRMVSGKKEQEQLMQHRNKMELDLENTQRQIDNIEISTHRKKPISMTSAVPMSIPSPPVPALVNTVVAPVTTAVTDSNLTAKQRLGPPVRPAGGARIAPVSRALAGARRDPRLARRSPASAIPAPPVTAVPVIPHTAMIQQPPIAPNVFDIKPLERVTKRKNVITIDVDERMQRQGRPVRDPRLERKQRDKRDRDERLGDVIDRDDRPNMKKDLDDRLVEKKDRDDRSVAKKDRDERNLVKKDRDERNKKLETVDKKEEAENNSQFNTYLGQIADSHKVNKLPPIPKLNREDKNKEPTAKQRNAKLPRVEKKKKAERDSSKDSSSSSSPEKRPKSNSKEKKQKAKPQAMEMEEEPVIAFKELKNYHKEHYMRRNKEKSESPEKIVAPPPKDEPIIAESERPNVPEIVTETGDVDLRVLPVVTEVKAAAIAQKRPSVEALDPSKAKKSKVDKFDILFGCEDVDLRTFGRGEDVDLRTLPHLEEITAPPPPMISEPFISKVDSPKEPPKSPIRTPQSPVKTHQSPMKSPLRNTEIIDSPESSQIEDEPISKLEENHTQDNDIAMKDQETTEKTQESFKSPLRNEKGWDDVKKNDEGKKAPSKLDLVRAKLAEATKGKDRLGRPLLFTKSPSEEKDRRRTISSNDDADLRSDNTEEFDAEDHKKTINIIMSQAKEQFNDGQIDKNQYQTLMYQVLQINEKLKLKEAKQRESLELSKMKLKATIKENKVSSPRGSPVSNVSSSPVSKVSSSPKPLNNFGDIDERIPPPGMGLPPVFMETPPDSQGMMDADMRRMPVMSDIMDGPSRPMIGGPPRPIMEGPSRDIRDGTTRPVLDGPTRMMPIPPGMPPAIFMRMQNNNMPNMPIWRGQGPRLEEPPRGPSGPPSKLRGPMPPFFRGPRFDSRGPRPPIDLPPGMILPVPKLGIFQGPCPCPRYERCESPPPLGAPGFIIPPTDFKVLEYIELDPVKSIMIDGTNREIRYYGETAVIMMDWDDPRELKFLPGSRRVTFDNKDSVVLSFNDNYREVEIDDQVFLIRLGAPTRELYINRAWYECFFGGGPFGAMIDGKPRLIQVEGPLPQVDIGKDKRTDLVLGKINLIVDATHMCPVFLDAKVQKCIAGDKLFTIRFVDCLRTVLINDQPFQVEFGGLPKPINLGTEKHFIRFSVLPRGVKPGFVQIQDMEGSPVVPMIKNPPIIFEKTNNKVQPMEVDNVEPDPAPVVRTPSPEAENQGLDMLASLMTPTNLAPATGSEYLSSENLFSKPEAIPGLDSEEKPAPTAPLPILGLNVNDLFAKLVATGIVQVPKAETKQEEAKKVEEKQKPEDKNVIHRVDLLKPETLRVKQPGIVAKLYGGMQCSGCGTRFPPEHTVRYSQHLDWHFRQNRRERDSARRAHSRHWHYDLPDWVQYEEVEDLEEREKNWFETTGAEGEAENLVEIPEEAPSVPAGAPIGQHCALCGDLFDQFYNEDKEEWHLRNSVRHEDKNYHPQCFEDYKASQAKVESPKKEEHQEEEEAIEEQSDVVKIDDTIEIVEADDTITQSDDDDESIVEVVEPEEQTMEPPVEIDEEGDEDDVIYKAEPVVQVDVEDGDTDDETQEERAKRDQEFDFSKVKVKQEPVDPDDEPVITAEEKAVRATVDTTQTTVLSSIDGNVQLTTAPVHTDAPIGIRINISKSIPSFLAPSEDKEKEKSLEDISADDEPLPPGEEPELEYKLKPNLEGVQFSRQPPVRKGTELSGLCSIM